MDSGNSGSIQSSSTGCGDEEYDSRVESSISAFLNNAPSQPRHVIIPFTSTITNNIIVPNTQHNHHMLDLEYPLSNFLDPNPIQQRSYPNMMWSKAARSEPIPSDLGGLIPCSVSSSSSQNQQQAFDLSSQTNKGVGLAAFSTTHHSSMPSQEGGLLLSDHDQAHNHNKNMVRNPKKRSRASRRAPTTVLTTDTTNFRAMVQEFTGIPAPPFTSSSFPRTRLDLFGNSASTMRSLDTPSSQPSYLLRPFAQKLHPFPTSSTSSIPSMVDNTTTVASNHSTNSTSINYQQLSSSSSADHFGLLKQHHQLQQPLNMMNNMHNNQILSFQSILQGQAPSNTKLYPLGNSNVLEPSKTQRSLEIPNTVDSHLKMSVLEELGLSHGHVNSVHVSGLHHNMVSSSSSSGAALSRVINNNMRNPSSVDHWVQRTGTLSNNNDGDDDHGGVLRSLSGNGNYNNSNNNVHGEKGPECGVAARSEGMVESWINCSSD